MAVAKAKGKPPRHARRDPRPDSAVITGSAASYGAGRSAVGPTVTGMGVRMTSTSSTSTRSTSWPAPGRAPVSPAWAALAGEHPMAGQVRDFLADQEFAGCSRHTVRA